MAKYITKLVSKEALIAENLALKQQLNGMGQNNNSVSVSKTKEETKFLKVVDIVTATHTTPCKNPNGVMLHLKGQNGRGYLKYVLNEQLPKIPFGVEFNVFEYINTASWDAGNRTKPTSLVIKAGNLSLFGFALNK